MKVGAVSLRQGGGRLFRFLAGTVWRANPYFREGLETGEEVVTIVESAFHDERIRMMSECGIPVQNGLESGQLKVLASEESYIKDKVFVVERMFGVLAHRCAI